MTAQELLARQRPLVRAVGRHAAAAVAARLTVGGTLIQAVGALLNERERQRAAQASATDRAARERHAIAIARLELEIICAFTAAGIGEDPPGEREAAAVRLVRDRSWRLVELGFAVLADDLAAGQPISAAAVARAHALAADATAPVWSQTAALRFLAETVGRLASVSLQRRLRLAAPPDDMFVRAEVVRLLVDVDPSGAAAPLAACATDPSEHVRIELCAAWRRLGRLDPLRALMDPETEESPRVRAAAAIAISALDPAALIAVMTSDPDEIPRRVAMEEAERCLGASRGDGGELLAAIRDVAAWASSGTLRRLAAEALERIHHRADPQAAAALAAIEAAAAQIRPGESMELVTAGAEDELGRALATAAAQDHGLSLERQRDGRWRLFRGDRLRRRWWRILHELRSPSGEKRQSHRHTTGRSIRGHLRAGSGILAEVSPTPVPGERVLVPALGDWGRHLPTVDDLLTRPDSGQALIFSGFGVTRIAYPAPGAWRRSVLGLHRDYATLAAVRQRALTGVEPRDQRAYAEALAARGFRLHFQPYRADGTPEEILALYPSDGGGPSVGATSPGSSAASSTFSFVPAFDLFTQALELPRPGTHLLAVGVAALGLMMARLHQRRRELREARARIPLCIGGWGTRGKSGTERLKAALFQGLGCRVLAKTTGCEAVLVHGIPDVRADEIYLYRPYDKATIWEQQEVLSLGAALGVDVLLWECMALNPTYVQIIAGDWMRDDLCTLTNAYPDHENIQGPAGVDVAEAISQFLPRARTAFTAEEQMLPILRATAAARDTRLVSLDWRDDALLPADLLARFPYQEHPRNIALVLALGESLGVPRDVALKEMADWVVPDLGVLKTYPEAVWRGRRLEFSNGMSANERTGFLSNWSRLGFAGAGDVPGEWVVTVVNNRADRVSRSAAFAEILVRDVVADCHVLIGTNLGGLDKFIRDTLATFAAELTLFDPREATLASAQRLDAALTRADHWLERVGVRARGPERLWSEAQAMARGHGGGIADLDPAAFEAALEAARDAPDATGPGVGAAARLAARQVLASGLPTFQARLGADADAALDHLADVAATCAAVARWRQAVLTSDAAHWPDLERQFRQLYAALFQSRLLVIDDAAATGDQIIDRLAQAVPPGFRARIMGAQNIKGTGLDFAYRWLAYDKTFALARRMGRAPLDKAEKMAAALIAREDLGILDLALGHRTVEAVQSRWPRSVALDNARRVLSDRLDAARLALGGATVRRVPVWRKLLGPIVDVFAGVSRRWRADRTLRALARGNLAQSSAAVIMRQLVLEQKQGALASSLEGPKG